MKKRTIREWFLWADSQGYEWAHKAMYNLILYPMEKDRASEQVSYLYEALMRGFTWTRTDEGNNHWEEIFNQLARVPV
jgi:hypothetical protein